MLATALIYTEQNMCNYSNALSSGVYLSLLKMEQKCGESFEAVPFERGSVPFFYTSHFLYNKFSPMITIYSSCEDVIAM